MPRALGTGWTAAEIMANLAAAPDSADVSDGGGPTSRQAVGARIQAPESPRSAAAGEAAGEESEDRRRAEEELRRLAEEETRRAGSRLARRALYAEAEARRLLELGDEEGARRKQEEAEAIRRAAPRQKAVDSEPPPTTPTPRRLRSRSPPAARTEGSPEKRAPPAPKTEPKPPIPTKRRSLAPLGVKVEPAGSSAPAAAPEDLEAAWSLPPPRP
jgi:hypothetical protein